MSQTLTPPISSSLDAGAASPSRAVLGRPWLGQAATAAAALVATGGLAAANGGYFPTSWGWSALGLVWVAAAALALGRAALPARTGGLFLAGMAGLVAWTAVTATWSANVTRTALETQRGLVYLAGVLTALLLLRRSHVTAFLGGALGGVTLVCAYALATRLFPERLGTFDPVAGYRLSEPVGYWNGLGVLAALGAILAFGLAARTRSVAARASAAAATPVLLATLYFTFGRGAWIALGAGLLAALTLDPDRLRLAAAVLVTAPAAAAAVWLGSRSASLTRQDAALGAAAQEGHRLAAWVLALSAAAAALGALTAFIERRARHGLRLRRALGGALAAVALALPLALLVRAGGPVALAERAYDSFTAPPAHVETDLNERLFSFSGNGRADLWRIAWDGVAAHPLGGLGSGGYEQYWLQHRPSILKVRDAHSLYLETLAELGPAGLALLLLVLAAPIAAAVRARRQPLVPVAFGAYVAYLLHAGADWDWELAGVTLTALLCGVALIVSGMPEAGPRPLSARLRAAGFLAALALGGLAVVGAIGSSALARSADAAGRGDWAEAASQARTAGHFAPWSTEPLRALGQAELARGDLAAARASFERAVARDAGDWALWLDLARASEGRARLEALAGAERLNPLSPEIALFRAELGVEAPIAAAAASPEVNP